MSARIGPDHGPALIAGLRLLTVVLLVLAFVLPVALVAVGGKWLPCVILAVLLVLSAATVSAHADSLES